MSCEGRMCMLPVFPGQRCGFKDIPAQWHCLKCNKILTEHYSGD